MDAPDALIRGIVITPVYNDWESFGVLVNELSEISMSQPIKITHVVAVNDGSSESLEDCKWDLPITVLHLNSNMGHQRAISIGLSYIEDTLNDYEVIVVMDSDGEDRPIDILKLVETLKVQPTDRVIFAKRKKRTEGFLFKFSYYLYKFLFHNLTGQKLDFGNFSCIPKPLLSKVVSIPELWNHYSGGIIKSKIPYLSVGTDRGKRFHGQSKMNFQNLVLHGLSALSIYMDLVSIRLLMASFFSSIFVTSGLLLIVYLALFTDIPIPGWSSLTGLLLINILAIFILTTFLILLFQLNQKTVVKFPPKTFYNDFILSVSHLKT
ncbi:glycosyl transferase family 2 [Flavobacteriaceae bacterium MAR_2010_72]|nr:glycosyl transferase family 2 [Flavobacteriaceae bacterium MAR_2010_72]